MGHKGVSKRKPKGLKSKNWDATTSNSTNPIAELTKETNTAIPRTIRKGQAITSGMGGKEKYSESTTNKKK